MTDRSCATCEYGNGECHYPTPQKGGVQPFMAQAVVPDPRDGGVNCWQFMAAHPTSHTQEDDR